MKFTWVDLPKFGCVSFAISNFQGICWPFSAGNFNISNVWINFWSWICCSQPRRTCLSGEKQSPYSQPAVIAYSLADHNLVNMRRLAPTDSRADNDFDTFLRLQIATTQLRHMLSMHSEWWCNDSFVVKISTALHRKWFDVLGGQLWQHEQIQKHPLFCTLCFLHLNVVTMFTITAPALS